MKYFITVVLTLFGLFAVSAASPISERSPGHLELEDRALKPSCKQVTGVLGALSNLGPLATSVCSAYLKVPAKATVTTTTTPTILTTVTALSITHVPGICIITEGREVPSTLTVRTVAARAPEPKTTLNPLGAFNSQEVSSACGCLNITPTMTMTTTKAASPTTSTTVVPQITTIYDACSTY
ncbi:hypothetical protein F4780DRAFT_428945 [Xylariomycetidae sp. FL0641]|nr:hypothetical protein F4780DRAFT_428945 [Xylariomycetidae sp. FL0641]